MTPRIPVTLNTRRTARVLVCLLAVVMFDGCSDESTEYSYTTDVDPTKPDSEGSDRTPSPRQPVVSDPMEGIQFTAARRISQIFGEEIRKVSQIGGPALQCPPATVRINGDTEQINPIAEFTGSGSEIFLTNNNRYAYKVIVPHVQLYRGLSKERAVLSVLGNLKNSTVGLHALDSPRISRACRQRSMVTDFGGRYAIAEAIRLGAKKIAAVAARMIEIIREVHSFGIVHGDVHIFNIITDSVTDPVKGLKLIDFGRSKAFVDTVKAEHIKFKRQKFDKNLNPAFLAPFELEGSPLSRRDDMYRLSEILYILLDAEIPVVAVESVSDIARVKRNWIARGFQVFTEFHHEMRDLKFSERPDYEFWIAKFTELSL